MTHLNMVRACPTFGGIYPCGHRWTTVAACAPDVAPRVCCVRRGKGATSRRGKGKYQVGMGMPQTHHGCVLWCREAVLHRPWEHQSASCGLWDYIGALAGWSHSRFAPRHHHTWQYTLNKTLKTEHDTNHDMVIIKPTSMASQTSPLPIKFLTYK